MGFYTIYNTISGEHIGVFQADSEAGALDALAREAGYADHAAALEAAPVAEGELSVERAEGSCTLAISDDPLSLGAATTESQLQGYAEALAARLTEDTGLDVRVVLRTGSMPGIVDGSTAAGDAVLTALSHLEDGPWRDLIPAE